MYEAFYSLTTTPFSKEQSPTFESSSFKEATARLNYLLKARGMGVLVGEPGAGKTYALRTFSEKLNASLYKTIYYPLSTGTVMDFYRGLVSGLNEEPAFRKVDLFGQVQKRVFSLYKDKKVTPVFILDEMHLAPAKMLTDLGLLFNFHMDSLNPFVLILSGLPTLMQRLEISQAQPLNQRIIMRYGLEPLTRDEVKHYIEHHLTAAGASYPIFSDKAIEALTSLSHGWPRVLNNLCVNCLLLGAQSKKEVIEDDLVRLAAQETGM